MARKLTIIERAQVAIAETTPEDLKTEEVKLVEQLRKEGELPPGLTISPHKGFLRVRVKARRMTTEAPSDPEKLPF